MDSDRFNKWLDNINSNHDLRNRGMPVNTKEAWNEGMDEGRDKTVEAMKIILLLNRDIDFATLISEVIEHYKEN